MGAVIFSLIDLLKVFTIFVFGLICIPRSVMPRVFIYSVSFLLTAVFFMSNPSFKYEGNTIELITTFFTSIAISWLFFFPIYLAVGIGDLLDTMRGEGYVDNLSPLIDDGESTLGKVAFGYFIYLYAVNGEFYAHISYLSESIVHDPNWDRKHFEHYMGLIRYYAQHIIKYTLPVIITYMLVDCMVALISKINPKMSMLTFSMPIKGVIVVLILGLSI